MSESSDRSPVSPPDHNSDPAKTQLEAGIAVARRIQAGDTSALYDLAEQYGDDLYAIGVSITGSHDLAQDILQDVLVKVWDQRGTLASNIYDLSGFLRRLTRHRAIDLLRHEQSQQRLADRLTVAHTTERRYSTNPGQTNLEAADIREQVFAVLQTLPARCREIFVMHWDGGLSYAEIADTLGITSGTVRTQMYRAMKALSGYFEEHPL